MGVSGGPYIVRDSSLVLELDAADRNSYVSGSLIWNDMSGNASGGSLVNGPEFSNNSIVFDGTNDYINLGNINFDFSNGFTYFGFCKVNTTKNYSRLIDIGNGQDSNNIVVFNNSAFQNFGVYCRTGSNAGEAGGQITSQNNQFAPSTIYKCIAATIAAGTPGTRASSASLYYNGYPITYDILNGIPFVPVTINRTSNFIARSNWSADAYFDGTIATTLIYNRALSPSEIQQNYNALKSRFNL